jgi:hypothetical protein
MRWLRSPARLLLVLAIALTGVLAVRTEPFQPSVSCCDHLFYRSMAFNLVRVTNPELDAWPPALDLGRLYSDPYHGQYLKAENGFRRQPPYAYRIVTPLIARVAAYPLGGNINRAFYLVTFVSLVMASYWTARSIYLLTAQLLPAIAAVVTFAAIFRLTRYHLYNYMLVDPLAYALLAAGVYLLLRRNFRWFFLLSFVAVFNKETHLFLLASAFSLQVVERRLDRASIASYLAIVGSYLAFRFWLPIPNNAYNLRTVYLGLPSPRTIAQVGLAVFGVLVPFTLSRVWVVRFPLYLLPLAAGALLASLFAGNTDRAYVMAFPLVFLSVFGVRVQGRYRQVLAISPAIAFVAVEFARSRLPDIDDSWRNVTALVVFIVVEGALLVTLRADGLPWFRRSPPPLAGT